MAYADLTRPVASGFSARPITALFEPLVALYYAHATRTTLAKLSDRDLEDIGLQRADIEAIALGTGRFR